MHISWSAVKEIFFTLGSLAGVLAFFRPVFESKYQKDQERLRRIFDALPEQVVVDLEPNVYQSRMVYSEDFHGFGRLADEVRSNQEGVRFIGPYGARLQSELHSLLAAYKALRDLIQVPWWEPHTDEDSDGTKRSFWSFNKSAFEGYDKRAPDYAKHLDECADRAKAVYKSYQRLQIIGELHLLELPLARLLLKRRFNASGVAQG